MFDVVVVGSLNLDLVATTDRLPGPGETVTGNDYAEYPGGKGLNQAVAAARAGAAVALVGCVGDDAAGARLREIVTGEGIDDAWLRTVADTPTGRALISVDEHAENSIIVVPGANGVVELPADGLPAGRVVLAQLEIPMVTVSAALRVAHAAGSRTMLNPAPAHLLDRNALEACSIVVPNEHEVDLLGGTASLLSNGVEHVVVTLGGDGVDVTDAASPDEVSRHHAFAVEPIDTTGAGDSFCGALAARLAEGATLDEAIPFAAAAGALATTARGAVPSLPRRPAIDAMVASRP